MLPVGAKTNSVVKAKTRTQQSTACTRIIRPGESAHDRGLSYFYRGNAYHKKGDYDRAIADYNEAIRLNPKEDHTFNNRGYAYLKKGDYDRAIADFNEAIRRDPKDALPLANRGTAYQAKGDYDRAIADHNEAIRLDPKNSESFNARCWARATAGRDLEQALTDCNEALRLKPNDAATMDSRAFVYLRLNRLDEAIAGYDAALKLGSRREASLYGRGIAKLLKGDTAAGYVDIAAAKAVQADIAEEFAKYGIKPDAAVAPPAASSPASAPAANCARAETHWKSAEEIRTLAVYEDHLARFPNCDFAALAKARIETLKK